jgi:VanZ family protein
VTRPTDSARQTAVLTLLLYTGFVAYQSLADGGAWQCGGALLVRPTRVARSDVLANVVAYVPLGLLWVFATLGPAATAGRRIAGRSVTGVLLIALLSLGMELLQSCQASRVSSSYDLAANVVGGVLGVAAGLALPRIAGLMGTGMSPRETSKRRLRLITAGVAVAWVVSQTMPWVVAVDAGTMRSNLSFLRHWDEAWPLDFWRALRHAGAWMAVACAWRLIVQEPRHAAVGLLLTGGVSLFLQVLLDARTPLSFEELCGMGASATLMLPLLLRGGLLLQRARTRAWASGLCAAALVTVAAYELRPDSTVTDVSTQAFRVPRARSEPTAFQAVSFQQVRSEWFLRSAEHVGLARARARATARAPMNDYRVWTPPGAGRLSVARGVYRLSGGSRSTGGPVSGSAGCWAPSTTRCCSAGSA